MVFKGGHLYLFGGKVEAGEKDITLKDFYNLDTSKMDSWNIMIENDQMEWLGTRMMMRNSAKMMKMIAIWIPIDLYFFQIEIAVSSRI